MQRQDLERMTREQLIAQAERLGIPRPRVLTQPELMDEIIGRTTKNDRERAKARGWLGRARDLLARVVERGLHLPEAARVLRKDGDDRSWPPPPPPLPTVTLAEIYAAQGHLERAIAVLDAVIAREPDHREAKAMRERFSEQAQRSRSRMGRDKDPPSTQPAPAPPPGASHPAEQPAGNEEAAPIDEAAVSPEEAIPATAKAPSAPPARAAAVVQARRAPSREAPAKPALAGATDAPAESAADLESASTDPAPFALPALAPDPFAVPAPDPLAEPPLPERYDIDEVVAIAVDPRTVYLYWEVRPTTLAHARARHPDGGLCVRVASVIASWEGPIVDTRDLHVDALYGDRFLRNIQPGSNVRVSIGWLSADGFEPLAVGSEVTAPRAVPVESVAQVVARWEAEPVVAPFQSRRAEAPASRDARRRGPAAFAGSAATSVEQARAGSRGGPVDTGVAIWEAAPTEAVPGREEEYDDEPLAEAPWFEPGGSSELGRRGPGRVRHVRRRRLIPGRPGVPGRALGGASDLSAGGASELF